MKRGLLFLSLFFIFLNLFSQIIDDPWRPLEPPENLFVTPLGYATWDPPSRIDKSRDLYGYNIYLDGCFIASSIDCYWQFYDLVAGQSYIVGVEAIYQNGVSEMITYIFIYNPYLNPVQALSVTESAYATWEPPDQNESSRELLGYNVYLDVDFITFTTNLYYHYDESSLVVGQIYVSGVTAVYNEGESTSEVFYFTYAQFILEPPTNLSVIEETGFFTWDAPITDELQGYNVYLDSVMLGVTSDTEWQFENLAGGETYEAGVKAIYDEGESEIVTIEFTYYCLSVGNNISTKIVLIGNYPNPFNPSTTISFSVTTPGVFVLDIYNIKGERVTTLLNENLSVADYKIKWHGKDDNNNNVASGIYFGRLLGNNRSINISKMILLK